MIQLFSPDSLERTLPMSKSKTAPKASPIAEAAMAADAQPMVISQTGLPKNFRNHPDIENFFRFIFENDLREESLLMLDEMLTRKTEIKAAKKNKNLLDA